MQSNTVIVDDKFSDKLSSLASAAQNLCYQCGTCTAICYSGVPVRRMIRGAQLGLRDAYDHSWLCTTCRLCEVTCPRGVEITKVVRALRVSSFSERKAPAKLEQTVWGVYEEGNPVGGKKADRFKWAEGVELKKLANGLKTALYVGCASSYDPRLQKTARSLAKILASGGVEFGVLGDAENCCGDVVYQAGEEGFLEELIQSNINEFKKRGAETIITLSPHCFNMFKNVYPSFGGNFQVLHYTEVLADLVEKNRLSFNRGTVSKITYHDPCYLARYNQIYEPPRRILSSLKGVELVEMDENKDRTVCCSGGGGGMWMDHVGERLSHKRVVDAASTGANILATSCPYCVQNFEDGVKSTGAKSIRVAELAELVASAMEG